MAKRDAKIQKRIDGALTVGKLRKLLEEHPDDTAIGRIGHFGEVLLVDDRDTVHIAGGTISPSEFDWRDSKREHVFILEIDMPDLGEEPD